MHRSLLVAAFLLASALSAGCISPPCPCDYGYDTTQTVGYHVMGNFKRAFTHRPKQCEVEPAMIVQPAAETEHAHYDLVEPM